jgi:hypothetical protein
MTVGFLPPKGKAGGWQRHESNSAGNGGWTVPEWKDNAYDNPILSYWPQWKFLATGRHERHWDSADAWTTEVQTVVGTPWTNLKTDTIITVRPM